MNAHPNEILRRWRTAERHDEDAAAEAALVELFAVLGEARPRPGFADRVLDAAGLIPARTVWLPRVALAACLVLTASAVAYLPSLAFLVRDRVALAEVISGLSHAFAAVVDHAATLFALWKIAGALYDALMFVVLSPPVVLAGAAALLFSLLTLRWLAQLMSPQRSSEYVPAQ